MGTSVNVSKITGVKGRPLKTTCYLTTATTGINNNSATQVSWEAAIDDVGAWDSGSPTRITVPADVTGCRILLHAEWAPVAVGAGDYRSMRIFINGAQAGTVGDGDPYYSIAAVQYPNGTISDHQTSQALYIVPTNPGTDYFEMSVRQVNTGAGAVNLLSAGTFMDVEWFYD